MTPLRLVLDQVLEEGTVKALSDGSLHEVFPVAISGAERRGAPFTGAPRARHVAVDPNQTTRFADVGLQLVAEAGLADRLEFLPEQSELALPRLLSDGRQFDLAFVEVTTVRRWLTRPDVPRPPRPTRRRDLRGRLPASVGGEGSGVLDDECRVAHGGGIANRPDPRLGGATNCEPASQASLRSLHLVLSCPTN
jgi:hypothetical protein